MTLPERGRSALEVAVHQGEGRLTPPDGPVNLNALDRIFLVKE
jgi:hypothetical protein